MSKLLQYDEFQSKFIFTCKCDVRPESSFVYKTKKWYIIADDNLLEGL